MSSGSQIIPPLHQYGAIAWTHRKSPLGRRSGIQIGKILSMPLTQFLPITTGEGDITNRQPQSGRTSKAMLIIGGNQNQIPYFQGMNVFPTVFHPFTRFDPKEFVKLMTMQGGFL
jgi:hypothetical protein